MREIIVKAALNDPYDGVIRLLGDAQRFGFELHGLTLEAKAGGIASAIVTLGVSTSVDARLVAARLARHPAISHVDAQVATNETSPACLEALYPVPVSPTCGVALCPLRRHERRVPVCGNGY